MSELKQLPAPHAAISVEVKRCGGFAVVEYVGPSLEALHAAGCIDRVAFDLFSETRQRIASSELGECKRQRWYSSPPGWKIIWRVWPSQLDRMPGCSSADVAAMSRTEALALLSAMRESIGLSGTGLRLRERAIGQHQRIVQWAECEGVIWPDWDALRVRPAEVQPCA